MTRRPERLVALGALAVSASIAALGTPSAQTQTQAPFRSATELVSVYATVQDRERRLVPDLRQEDFIVTDNGREQPITLFSNEVSPFTVIILLDRSGSMVEHQPVVRDAASAFVRQMLPEDKARVGNFGNRIWFNPPDFSSNRQELLSVLRAPSGSAGASPVWLALDQSLNYLSGLEGRRVVLMLTDGHDAPARNHMRTSFKDVSERVKRAGVMIYAIGFASIEVRGGRPRLEPPDDGLQKLADVSGGGYFELSDTADLTRVFTRVAEELHHQYWLGFAPPQRDGKLHNLQVKVKRPGMTARGRQTYLAPGGAAK